MNDAQLLAELSRHQSKEIFEQIVRRHIDLVHAAAYRQTRDTHLAEDITQAVFLLLWQRAARLAPQIHLPGWLLLTTRNLARNANRKVVRQKLHENRKAQMTAESTFDSQPIGSEISNHLDDALAALNENDRDVILSRFFLDQSLQETAEAFGVDRKIASKRIERALDKLQRFLLRRGVTVTAVTLSTILTTIRKPAASAEVMAKVLETPAVPASSPLSRCSVYAFRSGVMIAVIFTIIVTCAAVLMRGPKAASPPPLTAPALQVDASKSDRTIFLKLQDSRSHQPLKDSTVVTTIDREEPMTYSAPMGECVIPLPDSQHRLYVVCKANGHVAMQFTYGPETFTGDPPRERTILMPPVSTIGGIVKDPDGLPLPGAIVSMKIQPGHNGFTENADILITDTVTSGADGRWQYDGAPNEGAPVIVIITHPAFPGQTVYQDMNQVPLLHQQKMESKFQAGLTITGTVVDAHNNPVDHAKVMLGTGPSLSDSRVCISDDIGFFEFSSVTFSGFTYLTVTAPGLAPAQVTLHQSELAKDNPAIVIQLKPGSKLEGMVVDQAGRPVDGAQVRLNGWNANDALSWSTKTDADGHFVWNDAPTDPVYLVVSKRGMSAEKPSWAIAGTLFKSTLYPLLHVSGTVVDAETKQTIPAFTVAYRDLDEISEMWRSEHMRNLRDGTFSAEF